MPQIIIQISVTFIVLIASVYFIWLVMFSIPYWPSDKKFINILINSLQREKVNKIAEFGAGDGRVALELCKQGYKVDAYEINPIFSIFIRICKLFKGEKNLMIYNENFLKHTVDYSQYQAIVLYLNPKLMSLLEHRMFKEMPQNSIIISNTFKFPNKIAEKVSGKMLLYRVKRN